MRSHKYFNEPEVLLDEGRAIIMESAENKFIYRVAMVTLILAGMSPKMLSSLSGDSERTLQSWVQKVDKSGWSSLKAVKQEGRPSRLTKEQIAQIQDVVKENPDKYGLSQWSGSTLSSYIKKTYNITYGISASQNLLAGMRDEGD